MDGWIKLSENDEQAVKYVNRRNIVSVNDVGGGVIAAMWNGDAVRLTELPPDEPKLPYDAEVEYLESTGTQYIDTPVVAADNVGYELRVVNWSGVGGKGVSFLFAGVFGSENRYGLGYTSSSKAVNIFAWWNFAISNLGNMSISNGYLKFNYLNSRTYDFNGVVTGALSGSYNASNTTIRLLNAKRMDTGENTFANSVPMKFSAFRISRDGAVVCDMVPVRVGSLGHLYDRANPTGGPLGNGLYGDFSDGKGGVTGFPANLVGPDKPKP